MPRHIAIVEDEPLIRANYVEALARLGYEVRGYGSRPLPISTEQTVED